MKSPGTNDPIVMSENGRSIVDPGYDSGMTIDDDVCYPALLGRDARFDGLFFVGVKTTGIYCRPVCTAKTPGEERR
jgi:methylphosphotriester-DNA--protein-cysteine methyltransferase